MSECGELNQEDYLEVGCAWTKGNEFPMFLFYDTSGPPT